MERYDGVFQQNHSRHIDRQSLDLHYRPILSRYCAQAFNQERHRYWHPAAAPLFQQGNLKINNNINQPNQIQSNPIQSNPIQSNLIQPNQIQSNPIHSNNLSGQDSQLQEVVSQWLAKRFYRVSSQCLQGRGSNQTQKTVYDWFEGERWGPNNK